MKDSSPSQPAPLPEIAQILALVNQSPGECPDKLIRLQDTLAKGIERLGEGRGRAQRAALDGKGEHCATRGRRRC